MSTESETLEFAGPVSDGWYRTQIPDWIALHPDLKDGAYRLYCILRALILEKQKNKIRVLSHEQIAFLTVGKNGKPASISTVKALLANLQEVGLVSNPDGSRIVTSSGPGTIRSRRRYQLSDWPTDSSTFTGWRNAFDKLDAFTDDWRNSRTDVSRGRLEGQKSDLDSQKSDEDGQKTDVDGQKSGENPAPTSDDASSLKEVPEVDALTSSSSAGAPAEQRQGEGASKKRMSPEEIIKTRLPEENVTHDEAKAVADLIDRRGAGGGQTIRSLTTWISNRDERELRRDLESVRLIERSPEVEYTGMENCALHSVKIVGGACSSCMGDIKAGDEAAVRDHADMAGSKYRPDLFRALGMPLCGSEGARSGARGRVPDHNFWEHVTDNDLKRLAL